ncbi:MAG: FCSD flavin-binding domain-containing protein [Rhodoferax sp.]|nr:FCSD flavin-binding domain-containing protein [Rhodoferax sp.]
MNGKETTEMSGINTCYSYLSAKEAVSVAGVYAVKDGKIIAVPNWRRLAGLVRSGSGLCVELAQEHPDGDVYLKPARPGGVARRRGGHTSTRSCATAQHIVGATPFGPVAIVADDDDHG